jgi:uncharacterized protein YwqG
VDKESAIAAIEKAKISDADSIISRLEPSIRLRARKCSLSNLEIGESRIGGTPDLPSNFQWPSWIAYEPTMKGPGKDIGIRLLDFIAQINLSAIEGLLPSSPLPDRGTLYFFYDLENQPWGFSPRDKQGARVYYTELPPEQLQRTESPAGESKSQVCKLETELQWTLTDVMEIDVPEKESDTYCDLSYDINDNSDNGLVHRMLGHPQLIQSEMRLECELVANGIYCGDAEAYGSTRAAELEKQAADWMLLLQIDTDENNPGWMFGDCGRIYFWIRRQDLAATNFDNICVILQCY